MAGRLEGRIALVTGAGQGPGEAIAVRFGREGAAGVVVNDLSPETAERTAAQVRELGSKALVVAGSVMDEAFVRTLIERAMAELGSVDIVVNNAGITRDKLLRDMT